MCNLQKLDVRLYESWLLAFRIVFSVPAPYSNCNGSSMRKSRACYNLLQVVSCCFCSYGSSSLQAWRLPCEGSFLDFFWPRHSIRFRRSVCSTRWDRQPQRRVRKSHCRVRCASGAGATRSRPAKAPARHEP